MERESFDNLHLMVRACFDEGRQRFHPTLTRITIHNSGFRKDHAEYIEKDQCLAVALENGGLQKNFSIWVNPSYTGDCYWFRATLVHELVHGYAGLRYGHNAHWRRWYYRVMWHMAQTGYLIINPDKLENLCLDVGLNYNYVGGELTLVREAFAKAESEHSQVLSNFWKRINAPSNHSV